MELDLLTFSRDSGGEMVDVGTSVGQVTLQK